MLIAFVAPKQYGKSTACNILKEYWGKNVTQVNFKDGLIAELKQNFPDLLQAILDDVNLMVDDNNRSFVGRNQIAHWDIDKLFAVKPTLIRTLMQNYGTEVRRGDRDSYWVDKWAEAFVLTETTHVMTDDVRFNNEAQKVKDMGGYLIRLNRTDKTSTDTHLSETEQKEIVCDYEITVGEGELDLLKTKLMAVVKDIESLV